MQLSDLSQDRLSHLLAGPGLSLRLGPFVQLIRSDVPLVAESLWRLYGDYQVASSTAFVDFQARLSRQCPSLGRLSRWASFDIDGAQKFGAFPIGETVPYLEWGLNWCVSQRAHDYMIIHASAMAVEDKALLIVGEPGVGKSTMAAALIRHGWRLLADELALISLADGALIPLPRPICLKGDSVDLICEKMPEAQYGLSARTRRKGTIIHMRPPASSVASMATSCAPTWIVFVGRRPGAPVQLDPLSRADVMMRTIPSTFNYRLLGSVGFAAMTQLVGRCRGYSLTYSDGLSVAGQLRGLLESESSLQEQSSDGAMNVKRDLESESSGGLS